MNEKLSPLKKSPIIFVLGATIILSLFLGLLLSQAKVFYPKLRFHTFIKKANGLNIRPHLYFKGIEIGRVTGFSLTSDNKIKVNFYILKNFIKQISKNTVLMLEENILTGDIDKFIVATEFDITKSSIAESKFIPWEDSTEGVKIRQNYNLDYSGNQLGLVLNQLSRMMHKLDKNGLTKELKSIVINTNGILKDLNENKIATKTGNSILELKKLIISSKQLVDNYKNPRGIILKMTDPNLRRVFRTVEKSLFHLKEILEKVHENKNEIGPLLENLNIVLKEVKSLSKKINRMPILDSTKRKEEVLNFEIDN
ncbi:MlaD family protein [Bacteriovoracales bacterium]|nr:MlaD family protein [Bacteriovoracales bacterium]